MGDFDPELLQQYRKFSSLKVGKVTYAVGSPKGLENTLSAGHISGLGENDGRMWVQTLASISPGSSDGGLFDSDGKLKILLQMR